MWWEGRQADLVAYQLQQLDEDVIKQRGHLPSPAVRNFFHEILDFAHRPYGFASGGYVVMMLERVLDEARETSHGG